ncbi:hypothetical protein BJ741DRAFT_626505 [Chytriomyces cf. hyalinus JEL632]|nr:hypothetical protein BJ741DRAFT_626505 [Chytriomyces cf. hyalinus JEL632]
MALLRWGNVSRIELLNSLSTSRAVKPSRPLNCGMKVKFLSRFTAVYLYSVSLFTLRMTLALAALLSTAAGAVGVFAGFSSCLLTCLMEVAEFEGSCCCCGTTALASFFTATASLSRKKWAK